MPHKPSVILTPTEKKAAVHAAREAVRVAKNRVSAANVVVRDIERTYKTSMREATKDVKAAEKDLLKEQAALLKLTPPKVTAAKAVPSPVAN